GSLARSSRSLAFPHSSFTIPVFIIFQHVIDPCLDHPGQRELYQVLALGVSKVPAAGQCFVHAVAVTLDLIDAAHRPLLSGAVALLFDRGSSSAHTAMLHHVAQLACYG